MSVWTENGIERELEVASKRESAMVLKRNLKQAFSTVFPTNVNKKKG